jgi:hypothetical protein
MTNDERRLLRDHLRGWATRLRQQSRSPVVINVVKEMLGWADHLDVQDITCVCGHLQGRHLDTNHQLGNLVQCFDCRCQRFRPKGGQ